MINPATCINIGLKNQMEPPEGPNAVPVPLDFSTNAEQTLDFSTQQQGKFSMLQGVYIDNSAGGAALQVLFPSTGHKIICPANSQGFFTALCPNPINVIFTSTGGHQAKVFLLNFPVSNAVWKV